MKDWQVLSYTGTGLGTGKEPTDEFKEYISSHSFNIDVVPDQNPVLFCNGQPIAHSGGSLVTISGIAKSRKTVIASAIVAATLGKETLNFSAQKQDATIFHMDTEQNYFHYWTSVKRSIIDAGLSRPPDRFHSIYTKDSSIEKRGKLMEYIFEKYKPDFFILDGIADLVKNINDPEEASDIADVLNRLQEQYKCCIIAVIHNTKSHGEMTGMLGNYLTKKCETSIKVEKDSEEQSFSKITFPYTRNKPPKEFYIQADEHNHYEVVAPESAGFEQEKRTPAYSTPVGIEFVKEYNSQLEQGVNEPLLLNKIKEKFDYKITEQGARVIMKGLITDNFIVEFQGKYLLSNQQHEAPNNQDLPF
jgi:hypothetical protein